MQRARREHIGVAPVDSTPRAGHQGRHGGRPLPIVRRPKPAARSPKPCNKMSAQRSLLRGTRSGVVTKVPPIPLPGQISLDVSWVDPDDPEAESRHARVGDEAVPRDLAPGDHVTFHYLMGSVTKIER